MRRLQCAVLAVIAAVGFASVAIADELECCVGRYYIPAPSWTGFYVGVNAGGAFGVNPTKQSVDFVSTAIGPNGLLRSKNTLAPTGGFFGGQIGYNYQCSPCVVLGVEVDGQWNSQKDHAKNKTPHANTVGFFGAGANGFGYQLDTRQKVEDFGTARLRGGVLFCDALCYLTGGVAWGTVKNHYTYSGSASPLIFPGVLSVGPFLKTSKHFSRYKVGWTVGTGVEKKLQCGWSVKLEYLFVDLGKTHDGFRVKINPRFGAAFTNGGVTFAKSTSHLRDNVIRLGVNYEFGCRGLGSFMR